ncbi:MAG: DEAD/DEAH box helicase [Desulfurococcales archaeon]|nr:DEAD/DEAH box helicase [Desulfurococcales archaeon]
MDTFKIRRWLSDDEFRELLEFSDYLGYSSGYKIFKINHEKLRNNGYTYRDIIAKLKELEAEISPSLENKLRELGEYENTVIVKYDPIDNVFIITSREYLKPYIHRFLSKIKYVKGRGYVVKPYLIYEIVGELEHYGFKVLDANNVLSVKKLPRDIAFKGELRDYQKEALEKWLDNNGRGIIALPTGSGKTIIAIAAIATKKVYTLVVVFTKEQLLQWIEKIKNFTDAGELVGAYYGEEKNLKPITVTTYQTAFKKINIFSTKFDFLIVDEAHHLPADKFRAIAMGSAAIYRMGLSATVARDDGKHEEIFPLMGGVVYTKRASELVKEGYLAPFVVRTVYAQLDPAEKKTYDSLRKEYRKYSKNRRFEEILKLAQKGDPNAIQAVRINAKIKNLLALSEGKIRTIERIVKDELMKGSKIIIFTQYKSQAEKIAEKTGALLLHGDLDSRTRKAILDKFKSMDKGVLVVTTLGDEGLDLPDVNVGILASGTSSSRQFIQRLGRLVRPGPGKSAVLYDVVLKGTSEEYQARKRRKGL